MFCPQNVKFTDIMYVFLCAMHLHTYIYRNNNEKKKCKLLMSINVVLLSALTLKNSVDKLS